MKTNIRFWDNKLTNIGSWECFIYDRMTKTDQINKNKINHRYYRYYNDGDFPKGLKREDGDPVYKWMGSNIIETALEKTVESNVKYLIKKYMTPENRQEFYKTDYFNYKHNALTDLSKWGNFKYWIDKNRIIAKVWEVEGVDKLYKKYTDAQKAIRSFANTKCMSIFWIIDNFDIPEYLIANMRLVAEELREVLLKEFAKIEKQYGFYGVTE